MTVTTDDRAAWHEQRRRGIGASEVAAVVGRSPWASPWSTWARKVGLVPPDDDDAGSDAAQFGKDLEPITAAWFHQRTGLYVSGEQMMLIHPERRWARATVDGLVFDGPGNGAPAVPYDVKFALGVLELKFTGQGEWTDGLPEHHRLQVQWQLYVSGLEHGWLAAFHTAFGRLRFAVYEVERDSALLAEIVPEVERFWLEHCVAGDPPPPDAHPATTAAMAAAWPAPEHDDVDLDAYATTVAELRDYKAERRRLDGFIALAENELRGALGERTDGRIGGRLVASWRPQTRTGIDVARLRADHGDRYDQTTTVRVLRLHGKDTP